MFLNFIFDQTHDSKNLLCNSTFHSSFCIRTNYKTNETGISIKLSVPRLQFCITCSNKFLSALFYKPRDKNVFIFQSSVQLSVNFNRPLMNLVILRTHKRTKSNSFQALSVVPSVGLFSKLTTKPTKPIIVLSP
jgi:hypothetical protein